MMLDGVAAIVLHESMGPISDLSKPKSGDIDAIIRVQIRRARELFSEELVFVHVMRMLGNLSEGKPMTQKGG